MSVENPVFGKPGTEYAILEIETDLANRTTALDCTSGTGIKIRARQPRQRSSKVEIPTQGVAPRRIHLQMNTSSESIASDNTRDFKPCIEDKVQRADTEVRIIS